MLNDSVREELATKITPLHKMEKPEEVKIESFQPPKTVSTPQITPIQMTFEPPEYVQKQSAPSMEFIEVPAEISVPPIEPVVNIIETSPIMPKQTSQTLVDFQNKNTTIPDWRLQLQNSVRKRIDEQRLGTSEPQVIQPAAPRRISATTNGATALKHEIIEQEQVAPTANPTIANALRRIEESRKRYLATEKAEEQIEAQTTIKQFPRSLQNRSLEYLPKQEQAQFIQTPTKQNVVQFSSEPKAEAKVEKYDTAKLPPLPPPAKISSSFDKPPTVEPRKIILDLNEDDEEPIIHRTKSDEVVAYSDTPIAENIEETEENDDFAPISLRFNAAIFDLLIGSFLSFVLMAPFMLLSGRFFSFEGFFAFLATCAIVMFLYMTTTIAFLGRTFGMRLFALEIIDIEENDYPSLHQAAVSSSVYLLSLGLGGIGFLTMLANNEKRAAHDLLSKTIIVKEY